MTGNQHDCLLIGGLALSSFNQFFHRRCRADSVFKEVHPAPGNIDDASRYVQARDLDSAAVMERKLCIIGLHGNGGNNAIVIKLEKSKAGFKAQRIVFNLWRVCDPSAK